MSVFRRRGFKANKKEQERRKEEQENRTNKLWGFFLKDGEEDVPIRFLTEEPVLFYEHSIPKQGGGWDNATCTGSDCEYCETGNKPSYKGAWLIVDGREREVDEYKNNQKTGKKRTITDQIKLYKRGTTDIAKLDRQSRKFGLTSRPWFATKTGSGTSTSYELDRGEKSKLTKKEIQNILAKAPEQYRDLYTGDEEELYNIVEYNLFDDVELGDGDGRDDGDEEFDDEEEDLESGVRRLDDEDYDEDEDEDDEDDDDEEEEEERPRKKIAGKKKSKGLKVPSKKRRTLSKR